ncbi:MAG: hypothetical protein COB73_04940 [Flavobacteriaceae bacterium]|nr:MAG: hypothetical protein COB73_04940 [Flavobacteriaceae bacterium]
MENASNKLVTILNTQFIHEVQIAQSKLELEGIQSYLVDENIISTIGTAFVEGYRLQVNSTYVEKSKQIIDTITE